MTIGAALKRFRLSFNLTQDDIANALKVTRQAYHFYERDKANPPSQKILDLANTYNVSADYLLGRSDEPHPVKVDADTWGLLVALQNFLVKQGVIGNGRIQDNELSGREIVRGANSPAT